MNTIQQNIEQSVRTTLGDMHIQLIVAQAKIAELEEQIVTLTDATNHIEEKAVKLNGKVKVEEVRP